MVAVLKNIYRHCRKKIRFYSSVNWIKTYYFNYSKFPYATAKKLPVFFYGKVNFQNIKGEIVIEGAVTKGMIAFGKRFEKFSKSKGIAEICIEGKMVFKGHALFGKDYFVYVAENALLEIGNRSGMGNTGKIVCTQHIKLGDDVRISFESQLMDSNFHQMIDTQTGEKFPMSSPIIIGNNNFLGNRVSVMPGTVTPDYCTVASNSLCNKNYAALGNNILIGGAPAKLIRQHISRDWVGEAADQDIWKVL